MNREAALHLLGTGSALERLRAARALLSTAEVGDRPVLHRLRGAETDSWVQHALDAVLERLGDQAPQVVLEASPPAQDEDWHADIRAQCIEHVTSLLVHELRQLVAFVEMRASREIAEYKGGPTNQAVDQLREFLKALRALQTASSAPTRDEIDLTEVVHQCVTEFGTASVPVSPARSDPVVVQGDAALVRLALTNALRNAIESTEELLEEDRRPVVVNWGATDRDAWISVIDDGIGLPHGPGDLAELGVSHKDKQDHFGLGLTIAKQASASLRGEVKLLPRKPRGAAWELRWPGVEAAVS